MRMVRVAVLVGGLAVVPTVASAQTTTTSSSVPTTTAVVTRIEDLVCGEPVNNIATCVDPQGRIVTRIDEPRQTTTTVPFEAVPAPRSTGRPLALTG